MSLREAEISRSRRAQHSHQKQVKRRRHHKRHHQPLSLLLDSQVLTIPEWCRLGGFSLRTGRRIISSGAGPVVTQLSAKRIGITVANDRAWKAARARTTTTTTT
jgi:hypothetical protein